ncbi:MAG: bifunctional phosphoglucose/phosphomannose isomerase [Syntrophomonadaceae bacterium]|nr:bifunctional phosphoglucose/phosphomannose isomerase [Syntrophomonadaceae bacterium]
MGDFTTEMMLDFLYGLPEQFQASLEMDISVPAAYQKAYGNVLVSGLGGSAIGGDILKDYAASQCPIPVIVNRDYHIPEFVNNNSLFMAVSYSGNTEETLQAYSVAIAKGAKVICITGGGKLAELANKNGNYLVKVPNDLVPRAATGYLMAPLALVLEELKLLTGVRADLAETYQVLKDLREKIKPEILGEDNSARLVAEKLQDSIPIIWGASGLSETAALRWKAQINENAKSPAFYNVFPELNHNEIVGFEVPADLIGKMSVVILKDRLDNLQVQKRMNITSNIIKNKVKNIIEINSQGESFLARFYSLAYVGDYASVYLAINYGINPTPVKIIDYLKEELAK